MSPKPRIYAMPGRWIAQAACRDRGATMLVPDRRNPDEWSHTQRNGVACARYICSGCGVRAECRAWACGGEDDDDPVPHHVAGGLTPSERRQLRDGRR